MRRYTIILRPDPDEGGYSVTVPALPGCFTQGDTAEEATENARDAIQLSLEDVQAEGQPIPVEDPPLELAYVEVE
jgi:antitoxin HicB